MTENEKQELVEAVVSQLKSSGTDISSVGIIDTINEMSTLVGYDKDGKMARVKTENLGSDLNEEELEEIKGKAITEIGFTKSPSLSGAKKLALTYSTISGGVAPIIEIPAATSEMSGVMSASDKVKLNNSYKDLNVSSNEIEVELDIEDNTEKTHHVALPAATTTTAGVMSAEDKNKLNSVGANEYDALSVDRRTDGFAYHMSNISLGSTYEGETIARNTCSICKKITLEKGQKISYKSYAENLNAVIVTDVNNNVIFLSGAYTVAEGEYTATDTCYIYCTAYTNQISSDFYHCTVSASGMKATVERLESHVNILQSKTESFMQGYRELFVNGVFFADFEQGVWTGFGEVGEKYVEKITKDSTYSHYKFNVNKGTRLKYRLYAGGYYNIVATDTNGVILHKVGDSANWANHVGEYVATEEVVIYINQHVSHATMEHSNYYAILVDENIRPRIDIKASDSEIEIWYKLRKAYFIGGYDVYFEYATYTFKEIYDVWKSMNVQNNELPIGGGCNYYCNGSTFISVNPESGHVDSRATFGVSRSVQSFCIQDANIINIGGTYCFHDEGEAKEGYYLHKYVNCKMKYIANEHTTYLSKPLGGGMGLRGDVVIDNCYFENTNTIVTNGRRAHPVSWHGNLLTYSPCTFNLSIFNSTFVGGFIDLGGNEKNQGDTNTLYLSNNNADTEPYISKTGNWTTYIWNNDTNAPNLALRALFVAAGAEYNDSGADITKTAPWGETVTHKTGHYYLNGLGDITEEQMMEIYNAGVYKGIPGEYVKYTKIRTILPAKYCGQEGIGVTFNMKAVLTECRNLEVAYFTTSTDLANRYGISIYHNKDITNAFLNCSKLKYIQNIDIENIVTTGAFSGCRELVYVKLRGLNKTVSFSGSPQIHKDSILYVIQKAKPTSAITITLHADAYARLANDADIIAALEAKPLVTLVSA